MGSSYFGYPNMGNDGRTDIGGSSRKGKKGGSDKPKQPQRGLGVAQLEKIRLHGQLGSSNLQPSHHNLYHSSFNQVISKNPNFLIIFFAIFIHRKLIVKRSIQDDLRAQEAAYPPLPSSYFSLPSTACYSYNSHFSVCFFTNSFEICMA